MSNERTLLQDETNYQHTLQIYQKYNAQLPSQRKWINSKLGSHLV